MNKFSVNICPLCGKPLKYRQVAKVGVYECPTPFDWITPGGIQKKGTTHYEVEVDSRMSIQHMYITPPVVETESPITFAIDNFGNGSNSRLYKMSANEKGTFSWTLIAETPLIKEDTLENLSKRIRKLLTFL